MWHAGRSSARCRELRANLIELSHPVAKGRPSRRSHLLLLLLKLVKQELRMAVSCLSRGPDKDIVIGLLGVATTEVRLSL